MPVLSLLRALFPFRNVLHRADPGVPNPGTVRLDKMTGR